MPGPRAAELVMGRPNTLAGGLAAGDLARTTRTPDATWTGSDHGPLRLTNAKKQGRPAAAQALTSSRAASSTRSAWPLIRVTGQMPATLPSGPMRNVVRTRPWYWWPKSFLGPQTP